MSGPAPDAGGARRPAFKRRPPPYLVQLGFGLYLYGVVTPLVRLLQAVGRAESKLGYAIRRRDAQIVAKGPLRGYVPGPQDVFVATYPKSGTNWMLQIVHQLAHHGAGEYEHIHEVVPWPETRVMSPLLRRYAIPLEDAEAWRDAPEPLRAIKTHLPWAALPTSDRARYIAVIRDPKDVFVSGYHFVRDVVLGPAMPTVDVWLRMFIKGRSLGGSWYERAAEAWAQRHRPNVLVVSFKAMKRDLPATVRQVAAFLGVRASDAVLDAVCERSSFAYMKRIDHKFRVGKLVPWRSEAAMLRRGAHGGSAELLTVAQQREIDRWCRGWLRLMKSDLPYEDFADPA